jgi:threonine dehydrogenase-like Zn-dependent dehydrogenase
VRLKQRGWFLHETELRRQPTIKAADMRPVKRQWPRLFEHIRNGYLKPSDIITHRIPLEHIAEGYHIFSAKLDDCIKPLVVPSPA